MLSLINLFGRFDSIAENLAKLNAFESEKKSITSAQKCNYLPKTTKTQYKENKERLEIVNATIHEIKTNLQNFAINLKQIVNEEVMRIKAEKDILIDEKSNLEGQLQRIDLNLSNTSYIKSKHFESAIDLFKTINTKKLEEIEFFHSKISRILKSELLTSRAKLLNQLVPINQKIESLNRKLSEIIKIENPGIIVDHTLELFGESKRLSLANETHEKLESLQASIKENKKLDEDIRGQILADISFSINDKMKQIVNKVYHPDHKCPTISFTNSNYKFNIVDDTGTGQAYSNIIVFDLAVFDITILPVIIHDSHLFKNVQNKAIYGFISEYCKASKQSFIALDEIAKYGKKAENLILGNKVIELSNTNTLFIKDWRSKAQTGAPEPAPEPTPEPTPEPVPEPTPESTPGPTLPGEL